MISISLADCIFKIDELLNKTEWSLFQSAASGDKFEQSISVCQRSSDTLEVLSSNQTSVYITAAAKYMPYLLNEKAYQLCAETLMRNGVIHLHSSFVLYKEHAILFTGPSGIGKTTQAELWRDYLGATIVNGDVSLIRKKNGVWYAYGAPVHGSSPYCENMQAPIAGVVTLQQSTENCLERMGSYESLCFCLKEIYQPDMAQESQEILLDTIDGLFSEIPVYRLSCRPDEDAVLLVKKELNM